MLHTPRDGPFVRPHPSEWYLAIIFIWYSNLHMHDWSYWYYRFFLYSFLEFCFVYYSFLHACHAFRTISGIDVFLVYKICIWHTHIIMAAAFSFNVAIHLCRVLMIFSDSWDTMIQNWVFLYQRKRMQKIAVSIHQIIPMVLLLILWIRWMSLFLLISLGGILR